MPATNIAPDQIANVPFNTYLVDLLRADPTEVTFSNSAAENTLWSWTMPGGITGPNDALYLAFYFTLLNNSGSTLTYTFRLYFGGTVLLSMPLSTISQATTLTGEMICFIKNVGVTNSQEGQGLVGYLASTNTFISVFPLGGTGVSVIDTTGAQQIKATVQSSAATATQTINQQMAFIHYLKQI